MLRANLDRSGKLTSVNGFAAPSLRLSTKARLSLAQAARRAIATVRADPPGAEAGLRLRTPALRWVVADHHSSGTGIARHLRLLHEGGSEAEDDSCCHDRKARYAAEKALAKRSAISQDDSRRASGANWRSS